MKYELLKRVVGCLVSVKFQAGGPCSLDGSESPGAVLANVKDT